MSNAKARRSPRVNIALDVSLQTVDGDVSFKTSDASYDGVFLVSHTPLPLRKLIRFRTRLPDSDHELQMLGLVAHTVNPADAAQADELPGMGIQLFSLGRETKRRWREYIDALYEENPEARRAVESARRPKVRIRIPNAELLRRFKNIDLPAKSLFVRTPELHPVGTRVDTIISHPLSGQSFILPAIVAESIDGTIKERGLRLTFELPADPSALHEFLDANAPPSSDEEA